MRRAIRLVRWVLCMALAMSSGTTRAPAQGSAGVQPLAQANSDFGFQLLKELTRAKPHENVFISPYSISSVLQMVNTGARGQTRQELNQVLGTVGWSDPSLYAAYQHLNQSIRSQTNVILNIANAMWYRAGAQLNPEFAQVNQKYFGATLEALDFSSANSAKVMNDWAAQNTQGRIQTIITPPISGNTAIVLANAIYFKGIWQVPFDAKQTRPRTFHPFNGNPAPVAMMQQTRSFRYVETDGFQAVQLPYAGGELAMEILLPQKNSSLGTMIAKLDAGLWEKDVLADLQERRGTVILPRFTLRYGAELKQPLSALGVHSALTANADFSGMSSSRLFLSEIKHQSFVEVNEQGTEAAAVTTGIVAMTAYRNEPPPFQMTVDRPFVFCISDLRTRSVLFLGVVNNP